MRRPYYVDEVNCKYNHNSSYDEQCSNGSVQYPNNSGKIQRST